MSEDDMSGGPQPFLVAFPGSAGPYAEDNEDTGDGQTVMLDPTYFGGLDEVGVFLADLARHFVRAFIQSGRARDEEDALEQIREYFDLELDDATDEGEGGFAN